MVSEWKRTSLREAGVTLIDCDHRTPPAADSGYPYVAIPQLKEGRLALADVRRISPEHFADWTRKAKPQHHDVILSRRCNPGETAFVPNGLECALGQNLVLMRSDGTKIFPPFLRWLLNGPDWWEQVGTFINVGAIFNSLKCADIPNFKMPLPPRAEQKAIAAILGSLDDKIELNRRMNATLEAIARTLFQSWFVDFDPVRAKLDGRVPVGMDAETAELFPASFQDSKLGQIPVGWKVETIENATSIVIDYRGRTPKKMGSDWSPTGIPAVSAKNVKGGRLVRLDMLNYVSDELYERWMKDKLALGDILMTSEAPLGELYYLALDARFCLSQRIFALRANSTMCESTFLYYWLESAACQIDIINRGTGTTVEGIRQSELRRVSVLLPPLPIQNAAAKFLVAWTEQIHRNEEQSRTLANLRDTLLPKLLSGELSVSGLESNLKTTQ